MLKFRLKIVHDGHAKDLVQSQEAEKNDKESFHFEALVLVFFFGKKLYSGKEDEECEFWAFNLSIYTFWYICSLIALPSYEDG